MLSYREMTAEDVPAVLALRFATRENAITLEELEADYGITPASIAGSLQGSNVRGWLCAAAGDVVGFAMGDRASGEVQVVAVLPDFEGRGIGKTLLAKVCDWLFAEGHDEIWLGANPDPQVRATGFYRRLGWRSSGVMAGNDEVLRLRRENFEAAR